MQAPNLFSARAQRPAVGSYNVLPDSIHSRILWAYLYTGKEGREGKLDGKWGEVGPPIRD